MVSATTSPHHTITDKSLKLLSTPPKVMVDMAMPRDIEPYAGDELGVVLYNVDILL